VPSIDRLFESAAACAGADTLAAVLTGMGSDGRAGVLAVKRAGGRVLAEARETSVIFGMPKEAIDTGVVDEVLPIGNVAARLRDFATQPSSRQRNGT
jgi:two-component system chemotaxis response regulator CheB